MTLCVNAALVIRAGWSRQHPLISGLGLGLLVTAAAGLVFANQRRARLAAHQGLHAPPAMVMRATLVACLVATLTGVASVLIDVL